MRLTFELRRSFGRDRYFPTNALALALVTLTERVCFEPEQMDLLAKAGFKIKIKPSSKPKGAG